jgi:uncharacterized membrane protein
LPNEPKRNILSRFGRWLRRTFIAGLLVAVPIGLTAWILVWAFNNIDGTLQPLLRNYFGLNIPGVGFGIIVVLIFVLGVIMTNVLGKRIVRFGESVLARIPVAKHFYVAFREVFRGFSETENSGFLQVVLVEFPAKGMRTIGFITNEDTSKDGRKLINVFIPTAPNPTTGFLEILREEDIIRTSIPIEDALKMVVSGGKMSPRDLAENFEPSRVAITENKRH